MAATRRTEALPSIPAILLLRFNLWRLRRVTAGLKRARARGDVEAEPAGWRGVSKPARISKPRRPCARRVARNAEAISHLLSRQLPIVGAGDLAP